MKLLEPWWELVKRCADARQLSNSFKLRQAGLDGGKAGPANSQFNPTSYADDWTVVPQGRQPRRKWRH